MHPFFKHIFSFILPITVLIIVPYLIIENPIINFNAITFIGFAVMLTGLTIMFLTIRMFIRIGKGTLAPWHPTRKLVTASLYGYVRNPMILGVWTVLLGETIVFQSWNVFIWAICFFLINSFYFILSEEPGLQKRFGQEYVEYKQNVPRWIPRLHPWKPRDP